jgi:hypothetical protein
VANSETSSNSLIFLEEREVSAAIIISSPVPAEAVKIKELILRIKVKTKNQEFL